MFEIPDKKSLREVYRNYQTFKHLVESSGQDVISFGDESICFWDLDRGLDTLTEKQLAAFWVNIIEDRTQQATADKLGYEAVTTVQTYVNNALDKLVRHHSGIN